jgi:hypothetical protein
MNKLGIFFAGIVTCLLAINFIPNFFMYLIGCWQIGSWIGNIMEKLIKKEDDEGYT